MYEIVWYAHIGASLRDPGFTLRYIGRYTRRAVMAEYRITSYDPERGLVRFAFRDYAQNGKTSYKTLPVLAFIGRLIRHIPDKHFKMVRYAGLFAPRWRQHYLAHARAVLGQPKPDKLQTPQPEPPPVCLLSWQERRAAAGGDPLRCPTCNPLPEMSSGRAMSISVSLSHGPSCGPGPQRPAKKHFYPRPLLIHFTIDELRLPELPREERENLAAALFRLEQAREPEDFGEKINALGELVRANPDLRRSFTTWLTRVLLPSRFPGMQFPEIQDLQEIQTMGLAERVMEWTREWEEEGLQKGRKSLQDVVLSLWSSASAWRSRKTRDAVSSQSRTSTS